MNELIKDSLQTEDADGSDDLYSPVNEGEEFDEVMKDALLFKKLWKTEITWLIDWFIDWEQNKTKHTNISGSLQKEGNTFGSWIFVIIS